MAAPPTPAAHPIDGGRVRTIILARWVGAVFGLVQVLAYRTFPYPAGVREAALGLVVLVVVSNAVFEVVRRTDDPVRIRRLGLAILVTDVVAVSGLTWVYAFDKVSAIFATLFLLPIEGAVLFGLAGAGWTWAAVTTLYVGRELVGVVAYDLPFELESVTFRTGLIGIVALIVGLLVRDLVAQQRQTEVALADAERADASRARLVSMLAHDVRAPMAGAKSSLSTLQAAGDRISGQQRDEIIEAGKRQADRALFIARDLLDLARVEAGTLVVQPTTVPLDALVAGLLPTVRDRVDVVVDVGDVTVHADAARLEQVLFNLVANAAKHGAPPVVVSAKRDGEEVVVAVRDHGPGVPDGVELFTAFSHAGEDSVGLGMWIVRNLTEAMGGSVRHVDVDPGARFEVRLPAAGQATSMPSRAASGTTAPDSRS